MKLRLCGVTKSYNKDSRTEGQGRSTPLSKRRFCWRRLTRLRSRALLEEYPTPSLARFGKRGGHGPGAINSPFVAAFLLAKASSSSVASLGQAPFQEGQESCEVGQAWWHCGDYPTSKMMEEKKRWNRNEMHLVDC
jgi:hypothetical protein